MHENLHLCYGLCLICIQHPGGGGGGGGGGKWEMLENGNGHDRGKCSDT